MSKGKDKGTDLDSSISVNPMNLKGFPRKGDVVGQARGFIDDVIENVKGEPIFNSMGVSPDKTFLLAGPPGVGKTVSVNALNNELNQDLFELYSGSEEEADFGDYELICLEYSVGKLGTAYINMSSRRIQNFFDKAGILAGSGIPVMIVLDEVDALLGKRDSGQKHSEDLKVIETLMKNIQVTHDTERMYLTMMTNMPEFMDSAVLRAGRIDRRYTFQVPNSEERAVAFRSAIKQRNERAQYRVVRNYDVQNLVEMSEGFNYADCFQSVESAVRKKAKELIHLPRSMVVEPGYVNQNDLEKAVREHQIQFQQKRGSIGFKYD